jgi:hypothetical protein
VFYVTNGAVMPEGIGYGASPAFQPSLAVPRGDQLAQQAQQINARQSAVVAETVQRQADFSSNRAESLARVAEQIEQRAQTDAGPGVGDVVDITV